MEMEMTRWECFDMFRESWHRQCGQRTYTKKILKHREISKIKIVLSQARHNLLTLAKFALKHVLANDRTMETTYFQFSAYASVNQLLRDIRTVFGISTIV